MATQVLTSTPTTLKKNGTADIDPDIWYTVQVRGNESYFMQTASTAPNDTENAFIISPFSMMQVKRGSGEQIYVSQSDTRGDRSFGTLIIEPSA